MPMCLFVSAVQKLLNDICVDISLWFRKTADSLWPHVNICPVEAIQNLKGYTISCVLTLLLSLSLALFGPVSTPFPYCLDECWYAVPDGAIFTVKKR